MTPPPPNDSLILLYYQAQSILLVLQGIDRIQGRYLTLTAYFLHQESASQHTLLSEKRDVWVERDADLSETPLWSGLLAQGYNPSFMGS